MELMKSQKKILFSRNSVIILIRLITANTKCKFVKREELLNEHLLKTLLHEQAPSAC